MYDDEDEDEQKDKVLEGLSGEVDDFAGKGLPDPNANQGVTVEISIKPHGQDGMPGEEEKPEPSGMGMVDGNEEGHDPIAHILGLCKGGCAY